MKTLTVYIVRIPISESRRQGFDNKEEAERYKEELASQGFHPELITKEIQY